MKRIVVVMVVALVAAPAMADVVTPTPFEATVSSYGDQGGRTIPVYDNTVNGTGFYYNHGGLEVGDDLEMTAGGLVDHITFGYYDLADDGAIVTSADIRFYDMAAFVGDGTDVPLATYTVGDLPGEGAWTVGVDLEAPFDAVPQHVVMSAQFDNTVNCGLLIYDPPVLGASQDMFWINDGTGNWYWFGGDPRANLCLAVEVVPEPASLVLLALGGVLLRRR